MPTLTIRNVPVSIVEALKELSRRNRRSMEQEVRRLLEERVGDRLSAIEQIEAAWDRQERRPTAGEVDAWIAASRP